MTIYRVKGKMTSAEIIFTALLYIRDKETGHGLALASCRKSVLDMGGDIEVKSEYGMGATFILTIPREYSGKPLAIDPVNTVIHGHEVERIYRD